MLAWVMVPEDAVSVTGERKVYNSSEDGRRSFCGSCGTGLFFTNALLKQMGMMQVQTAERVKWMASAHELPPFERFPG